MNGKSKNKRKGSLMWHVALRYRWLRRNWSYVQRIMSTEREIGGELHAC